MSEKPRPQQIRVRVFPRSKKISVEVIEDGSLRVHFSVLPKDGKANKKVIELVAEHFGVSQSRVSIIKGQKSRDKLLAITL